MFSQEIPDIKIPVLVKLFEDPEDADHEKEEGSNKVGFLEDDVDHEQIGGVSHIKCYLRNDFIYLFTWNNIYRI